MIKLDELDPNVVLANELKEILNKLVIKHATVPYTLVAKSNVVQKRGTPAVSFHDPNFPKAEAVGWIAWTRGSRSPMEYMVNSRLIDNAKHRWDKEENSSLRTKDINKATKIAMEHIKPWDMSEFAEKSLDTACRLHSRWIDELNDVQYAFRPQSDAMAQELEHLVSLGVEFKTPEIKTAVDNLDKYKEWKRRRSINSKTLDCVMFMENKVALIKRDPAHSGRLLDAVQLSGVDELPAKHRDCVALLKVVGDSQYVPNVGYRVNDELYWVYSEDVV